MMYSKHTERLLSVTEVIPKILDACIMLICQHRSLSVYLQRLRHLYHIIKQLSVLMQCGSFSGLGFDINFCDWTWSWTLEKTSSIWCHVAICVFYAVSVKLLQTWVASQKNYSAPKWLEPFRKVHNMSLAIVSFIMFVVMTGVIAQDGRLNSWHDMSCRLTSNTGIYGFINFIYLVSKIWEWVDTYILVLSNKPVIILHWFHHMTTFTMAALVHNFPVGGFALINCLVHAVMYMHYAMPQRWARPFITSSQLVQFVIVMSIHLYGLMNPVTCFNVMPQFYEWLFCMGVVAGFFVMFVLFFIQEYVEKKDAKRAAKAGASAAVAGKKKD